MLQNNFKDIYDPTIHLVANYDEEFLDNSCRVTEKIIKGKIITFENFDIKYTNYTKAELNNIDSIVSCIRNTR
ncbi:hypothetical protein [Rickettsia endosymbiont of Nabis limbatus]